MNNPIEIFASVASLLAQAAEHIQTLKALSLDEEGLGKLQQLIQQNHELETLLAQQKTQLFCGLVRICGTIKDAHYIIERVHYRILPTSEATDKKRVNARNVYYNYYYLPEECVACDLPVNELCDEMTRTITSYLETIPPKRSKEVEQIKKQIEKLHSVLAKEKITAT